MELTKKQLEIIREGQANGKTSIEMMQALRRFKDEDKTMRVKKNSQNWLARGGGAVWGGVKETAVDVKDAFVEPWKAGWEATGDVLERENQALEASRKEREDMGPVKAFGHSLLPWERNEVSSFANKVVFGGAANLLAQVGQATINAGKVVIPNQKLEDLVGEKFQGAMKEVAKTKVVQDTNNYMEDMKKSDPSTYSTVRNTLVLGEVAVELFAPAKIFGTLRRGSRGMDDGIEEGIEQGLKNADGTDFSAAIDPSITRTADEVIEEGNTAWLRNRAETEAPFLTPVEKWIGLQADQKKRLQGNEELLRDYINVTQARNQGDFVYNARGEKVPVPSPIGYGATRAETAVELLEAKLRDTGSNIGSVRQKLATTQVDQQAIESMEDAFVSSLNDLNLTVSDGKIVTQSGRNPLTDAPGDITVLQDLYDRMQVVKQAPNLQNYNEFRSTLDSRINYSRFANETSNKLDRFALFTRQTMREETGRLLGQDYIDYLDEYNRFMDAYTDLSSYTNRKAGGEYVIRLLDSGRSRQADDLIRTIADYTGIDLKDDAVMASLVTDMFGNARQKTTFQQELTKNGVDIAGAAAGSPISWLSLLGRNLSRVMINEEKQLIRAAQNKGGASINVQNVIGGATAAGGVGYFVSQDENGFPIVVVAATAGAAATPGGRQVIVNAANKALRSMDDVQLDTKTINRLIPEAEAEYARGFKADPSDTSQETLFKELLKADLEASSFKGGEISTPTTFSIESVLGKEEYYRLPDRDGKKMAVSVGAIEEAFDMVKKKLTPKQKEQAIEDGFAAYFGRKSEDSLSEEADWVLYNINAYERAVGDVGDVRRLTDEEIEVLRPLTSISEGPDGSISGSLSKEEIERMMPILDQYNTHTEPVKLYRGMSGEESLDDSRARISSWTTDRSIAQEFADDAEDGWIAEIEASPEEILLDFHSLPHQFQEEFGIGLGENEFLLKPKSFNGGEIPTTTLDPNRPTTKVLNMIVEDGRSEIPKNELTGMLKSPGIGGQESKLLNEIANEFEGNKIPAQEFAERVQARLFEVGDIDFRDGSEGMKTDYDFVTLAERDRQHKADVTGYEEQVQEGPFDHNILSGGAGHGWMGDIPNYLWHKRIELGGDKVWVNELQSDLFQGSEHERLVTGIGRPVKMGERMGPGTRVGSLEAALFKEEIENFPEIIKEFGLSKMSIPNIEKEIKRLEAEYDTKLPSNLGTNAQATHDVEQLQKLVKELENVEPDPEKLAQYNELNAMRNTWWQRAVREDLRSFAMTAERTGRNEILYPTGSTAAKIQGFGGGDMDGLRRGEYFRSEGEELIVVDLGGGEIWGVPKSKLDAIDKEAIDQIVYDYPDLEGSSAEQIAAFINEKHGGSRLTDHQGKVFVFDEDDMVLRYARFSEDEVLQNPTTKFYEKDLNPYLVKNFDGELVTDENGYTWISVDVSKLDPKMPIEAFGLLPFASPLLLNEEE